MVLTGIGGMRMKMTERHVQAIWYDRDLRPDNLLTADGERVRVIHPGEWNRVSGPDFRSAVLEIGEERKRLVGDVEIHLAPSDWDAHGHGRDPAYRHVVAHVTWCGGDPPETLPQGAVSICLGRYLSNDIGFSTESIDLGAYPFDRQPSDERPCRRRMACKPDRARRFLADAGSWRLRVKAERMKSRLKEEDLRQVFYSEVMNALGYGKNGAGFRLVASAVPYSALSAEPGNVAAAFRAVASFVDWNRDRVRPGNSPEARLDAAARLFTETDVMSLMEANDFSQASCRRMLSVLRTGRYVGRGRAAAVMANVVVPFSLARGLVRDAPPWLPPEDISEPVRRVAFRMFGGDHNPRTWYATNGMLIQGLIQIDRERCARLHPECTGCEAQAA